MDRARNLEIELAHSDRLRHEALKQSEAKLRGVIDTVPAMISATDSDGRYVFLHRFQAHTFGVSQEEAVGKTATEVVDGAYGGRSRDLDAQVFAQGRTLASFEETLVTPSGEKRILLTTKSPLCDSEGRVVNVVTVALDITERKQAEVQLRETKEAAELANRTKTEFMDAAVAAGSLPRLRDAAHALRSCSGNIGAAAMREICGRSRTVTHESLPTEGKAMPRSDGSRSRNIKPRSISSGVRASSIVKT